MWILWKTLVIGSKLVWFFNNNSWYFKESFDSVWRIKWLFNVDIVDHSYYFFFDGVGYLKREEHTYFFSTRRGALVNIMWKKINFGLFNSWNRNMSCSNFIIITQGLIICLVWYLFLSCPFFLFASSLKCNFVTSYVACVGTTIR